MASLSGGKFLSSLSIRLPKRSFFNRIISSVRGFLTYFDRDWSETDVSTSSSSDCSKSQFSQVPKQVKTFQGQ